MSETTIGTGFREVRRIPVTTDLDGSTIEVTVNVVTGARPGPTLAVVSGLHGSEWLAPVANLELLEAVDEDQLAGTLLVVPVANPIAFATGTRNIRDESDSPDLNRSFGGAQTWLADQLAKTIVSDVLENADAVIDFHCGPWGAAMNVVGCANDYSNDTVNEKSMAMAKAFGRPHVRPSRLATVFPGPKSMIGYAGEVLGIPAIVSEVGGVGFDPDVEATWKAQNVDGVLGVMAHLGMVDRSSSEGDVTLVGKSHRVNPTKGGMIEPILGADHLMAEVSEGDLLGRVWDPFTFEYIEDLRAPVDGVLGMVATAHPARPGDWAYLVFEVEGAAS
jgi:predicted deacylase